jgi:cytoskeletal protein CcmA (bactofilin family)
MVFSFFSNVHIMAKSKGKNSGLENFIPEGTEINGSLNAPSNLRIEGKLEGKVVLAGKLTLGSSGKIIGDVECKNAKIDGLIEGNLLAADLLQMSSGSKIIGNTVSAKIILGENCQISGSMKLKK